MNIIKDQVRRVISYSQDIPDPKTDELIDQWYEAKKKFIKIFGGPIYEVGEVEFHLSEKVKESRINDFIDRLVNTYGRTELANFIGENREGFFDNRVLKDYPNIPKGMKLVRAFKYFEKENQTFLERLQSEASQIIQEDKIKGTLCLSVHPLDFLSSSENDYNWRSCHALNGEYRSGNLSYMCDSATFMCYIKGKDNAVLPRFPEDVPWNSKKWRMLLYLSEGEDMMFAGRQYPFSTNNALDELMTVFRKLPILKDFFPDYDDYYWMEKAKWEDYIIDEYDLDSKYIRFNHRLYDISDFFDEPTHIHFNDVRFSSCYNPHYAFNDINLPALYTSTGRKYTPTFKVGAKIKCLHCGEQEITDGATMRCNNCELEFGTEDNENYSYCDHCGARHYWEDLIYINDDYRVCNHCFNEVAFECPRCGEFFFQEDAVYNEHYDEYYCSVCAEHVIEEYEENKERV